MTVNVDNTVSGIKDCRRLSRSQKASSL